MSAAISNPGVAATTPTSSKVRIPRHTTQEDLATAELLQNFNQQTERFDTTSQSARRQGERLNEMERESSAEQARMSKSPVSEYHSLDDAVSYPRNNEHSPQPSSEQRISSSSQVPNAPNSGQICRYVATFSSEKSVGCRSRMLFHGSFISSKLYLRIFFFHGSPILQSRTVDSDRLTFAAIVEQHEHHYGGARQPERPSAMPVGFTTRLEIKCGRQI